jgi:hypothetical protein
VRPLSQSERRRKSASPKPDQNNYNNRHDAVVCRSKSRWVLALAGANDEIVRKAADAIVNPRIFIFSLERVVFSAWHANPSA